ncbi:MAG: hypothetical protein H7Z42_20365 [Roseiflexaceae bacterium]|nr:hypothetical protein [Roseiflexaceae bacterium]
MCRKKRTTQPGADSPYEGSTQRLSEQTWRARRAFPWWTLWLIWPLVSLVKYAGATLFTGWSALGDLVVPANVLAALALVIFGVALLLRERSRR